MLKKFGYVTLTHPQKKMPIYVDVLTIDAIEPFIWHEPAHLVPSEIAGEEDVKVDDQFHFVSTVLKLKDRVELHVRERPSTVAKRMKSVMELASND